MTIDNAGNVGIGTTSPAIKLTVQGTNSSAAIGILNTATTLVGYLHPNGNGAGNLALTNAAGSQTIQITGDATAGVHTYFNSGNLGIGTTSPTAVLHLKAGTATASTAPLKFTSGTLNTTAEAGAIEFLTDSYYATTTTGAVRRMIVAGNTGRATAQTAANASVATYTLGASDASYEVSANVLVTTATTHAFTVTCAYTDEGNTARTVTMTFGLVAGGVATTSIANANGAVPYMGVPLHIRCKASTAITIATTGTFTTVTYNVEGI